MGSKDGLQPIEKTVIDRCVHQMQPLFAVHGSGNDTQTPKVIDVYKRQELIFVTNIIIILAIFLEAERKHMNFNIASGKQSCLLYTSRCV